MEILKDPEEIERANRQTIIKDLDDIYNSVDKLIHKTYLKKETELNFQLRNIKTDISQLLSDMKSKNLDAFSGKKGTLNEFYQHENKLLEESTTLRETFSSLISSDSIDVFMLENILDSFKKGFNNRITVDLDIMKEFKLKQMEVSSAERVMSGEKKIPVKKESKKTENGTISLTYGRTGDINRSAPAMVRAPEHKKSVEEQNQDNTKKDIDTETLGKIYNYMNILENKYSTQKPEISFDGEYIGDKKWKVEISDKFISGTIIRKMVLPVITFETFWKPFVDLRAIMQFVQNKANSAPAGQYKSLCILNIKWNSDIKEWAKNYVHPRLVIYLCELETEEITYNTGLKNADILKIWHNQKDYVYLEEQIEELVLQDEPFNESDVVQITGLNSDGAKKFLASMVAENKIIDVGFGKSRYTGLKNK
ncbi:hypothetical protein [Methanolobus bombayensis]|uniref:hypothetical protein n=1 Tax=Methanolobus bombayensis TaxID=38023 RepID=UPI001AE3401A|nr:hypothetical protein [Methanolobus bombayensis]MBP1909063.1 hypothetical protein [Methanolobus bombayensis]